LRIRGIATPSNFHIDNILDEDGILNEYLKDSVSYDKRNYCIKCNHSCYMMSEMISNEEENSNNLVHDEIRNR